MNRSFCVAPMMECTDRHYRYFARLISRHCVLYTEMITTGALLHGDTARFLEFDAAEQPLALQLGGSNPQDLARCARLAEERGYSEVNMNVGCPSDRVQSARFGACLMAEPALVADCVAAMRGAVDIPVTVKTRIGIDDRDAYEYLHEFITRVQDAGCETCIIHARKAFLQGLSPKENRDIPPLRYDVAQRVKHDFPELEILVNGGIKTLSDAVAKRAQFDGVMLGREAYQNPWLLADVDRLFYGDSESGVSRHDVLEAYIPYIEAHLAHDIYLSRMSRHILGLFQGLPGARAWRRHISENAYQSGAGLEVIREAAAKVIEQQELVRAS